VSVPPPVGQHRQPNPPPGWPGPPGAESGKNAAWVRVDKKLAMWVAAIVAGVIVGAVTPGLAGHVIALVVWAVAAGACMRPARSVSASGARSWARVGVVCSAAFAIFAGAYAAKSVIDDTSGYYQQNADNPQFVKGYKMGLSLRNEAGYSPNPKNESAAQYCQSGAVGSSVSNWTEPLFNGFYYGCDGQENAWQ